MTNDPPVLDRRVVARRACLQPYARPTLVVPSPADMHLAPTTPLRPVPPQLLPASVKLARMMAQRPAVPTHRAAIMPEPVPMVSGTPPGAPQLVASAPQLAMVTPTLSATVTEFALAPVEIGALGRGRQGDQGQQQDQAGEIPVTHGENPSLGALGGRSRRGVVKPAMYTTSCLHCGGAEREGACQRENRPSRPASQRENACFPSCIGEATPYFGTRTA